MGVKPVYYSRGVGETAEETLNWSYAPPYLQADSKTKDG